MIGLREKLLHRLLRIFKLSTMGDVTAGLHCETKICRRLLAPSLQRLRCGQAVKTIIDFDRVKMLGIPTERLFRPQIGWIERPAPMRIMPTRCPDMYSFFVDWLLGKGNLGRTILRMAEVSRRDVY
jgi:hypothetical protein